MFNHTRREDRVRRRAYEIHQTNQTLGIKASDEANWYLAEKQIEEEELEELRKLIPKETWL